MPPIALAAGPERFVGKIHPASEPKNLEPMTDEEPVIRLEPCASDGEDVSFAGLVDPGFIRLENGLILEGIFSGLEGEDDVFGCQESFPAGEVAAGLSEGSPASGIAETLCARIDRLDRKAEPVESVFELLDGTDFMVVIAWAVQVAAAFVCGRLLADDSAGQFVIITGALLAVMFVANTALFAFGRETNGARSGHYLKSSGLLSLASVGAALVLFLVQTP